MNAQSSPAAARAAARVLQIVERTGPWDRDGLEMLMVLVLMAGPNAASAALNRENAA